MNNTENNYAFIDGNNLYLGAKNQGIQLNYIKLRRYLRDKMNVSQAFLFIGFDPANTDFYRLLQKIGYILIYKPTIVYRNTDGTRTMKGNVDAELVLYSSAVEFENYDKAVIVSSDGDFACLVDFLDKKGKLKKIITPTENYSSLLKRFHSYILPLNSIRNKVGKFKSK